jgi:proton-translocating NAD(P)+ transhydrogenase subunit beta
MHPALANLAYLIASMLFILGLKGLTHPRTALRGNLLGALGMLIAVVTVTLNEVHLNWALIFAGLVVGGFIGTILAMKIRMTAMPQLVALFNGLGGGASLLVAANALIHHASDPPVPPALDIQILIAVAASAMIGAVTLSGSLAAFAKLQGLVRKTIIFTGQQILNALLLAVILVCCWMVLRHPDHLLWFWLLAGLSVALGIFLVMAIGGADMPVIIAALNSYSGIAASATGFVLNNNVLIISGSLVGASGMILTRVMCKAMNRSFKNVILGVPMGGTGRVGQDDVYGGKVKATSAEEAAMVLEAARRVVIVPGYGMAVSQAQFAVRDLALLLRNRDILVEFAIHPVAGRMPGHMNVLLAEADIPYEQLKDMDAINPTFDQTDVSLVIGANDVVNPDARENAASPIAGMPILDVDKSKTVIVIKRSLSPGFAGIPNPLFAAENALMLFDDGKKAIHDINAALREI